MKKLYAFFLPATTILLLSLLITSGASAQTKVVIAGTFQSELGCTNDQGSGNGDWEPNCDFTALTYSASTDLWTGTFLVPAGCQQYKVAIDGSWALNYGENGIRGGANIQLFLPQPTMITFTYEPWSHMVTTSPIASGFSANCLPQVVLAGSFQNEVGCTGDWDASCTNTALTYNSGAGLFEGDFTVPNGCYEYRVVLNNDWFNNFGQWGQPNGENYILFIPVSPATVHFTYDPSTHIVQALYNASVCQPSAVVLAGSFQSELGCAGDWMPDCDNTGLNYDPKTGTWIDTFYIPAGSWEYKMTINNSWDENYGLYGVPGGKNIPLELCYPAQVVFSYRHNNHYVYTQVITNGICVNKFYDANVNNSPDVGEQPMEGVTFTLTGNGIRQVQTTDSDGKATFTGFPNGEYTVRETVPSGYLTSSGNAQWVYVYDRGYTLNFGNVCLGPGGAKGIGYWISKNGEAALNESGQMQDALRELRYLTLRNADGSNFDPYSYDQFRAWLKNANAKNMSYMVSAQLAVLDLSQFMGYIDAYNSMVYTGSCGELSYRKFSNVFSLISNTFLDLLYYPISTGNDASRTHLECLKDILERANNNLSFVQPGPCGVSAIAINPVVKENAAGVLSEARIWPNPSSNYFTLRPATGISNEPVTVNVFDVNGKKMYRTTGSANQDYRIGDAFVPGVYFVELMQGNKRSTFKLVKQ